MSNQSSFFSLGTHPGKAETLRSTMFGECMLDDADAIMIVGSNAGSPEHKQLLLLRFFLQDPIFRDGDRLFHSLCSKMSGWEARRAGGSCGLTSLTQDFLDFLHLPGTIPRKVHASMIVQTEKQFFIYYVSPYNMERTVTFGKYHQPHRGGQCKKLDANFVSNHDELRSFASSKIVAAMLIKQLNQSEFRGKGFQVAKGPVQFELIKVSKCTEVGPFGSTSFLNYYVSEHCHHTVVRHAVGYHNDVFFEGITEYLENRVVLKCRQLSRRNINKPLGRGGLENGDYAWALLDW